MLLEESLHFDAEASCRVGEAQVFVEGAGWRVGRVHVEDDVALSRALEFLANRSHEQSALPCSACSSVTRALERRSAVAGVLQAVDQGFEHLALHQDVVRAGARCFVVDRRGLVACEGDQADERVRLA